MIYRRIVAMNARGQITAEERGVDIEHGVGPEVTTTYEYWPASGRLKSISGINSVGFDVQDLEYTWDQLGNLEQREEYSGSKSLVETFQYDGLNRLTQATVAGQSPVTVTYDPQHIGNIKSKTGVGTYGYNSSRPHAVTSAGSATYTYDANGNNLSGDGRTLKYTTFDKPYEITKGGHKTTFAYDPDRARYLRVDQGTNGTVTTRYIGSVEIIDRPDGTQVRRRYIGDVAIESRTITGGVEGGRTTQYVFRDHLGSLDVITDSAGNVVQELSFDAWGQRRNATDWQALSAGALVAFDHSLTTRGFTGHEMLDEVGLIHMNGRVYDPKLGRFLQADPFVQDPTNSQSLNRYSYVWNNPLNATDPSGNFVFGLLAAALAAAEIVTEIHAVVALFAAAGFADVLVAGGSFKDALLAGISSAAFAGFGAKLGSFSFGFNAETIGRVAAFGTLGGMTSVLQGGKFGHGFQSAALNAVSGGVAARVSRGLKLGDIGRAISNSIAGGTASALTGGKFANGATSAALQSVISYVTHANKIPKAYTVQGKALSQQEKAIMDTLLVDTHDAVTIVGAEWLVDFESIEFVVSADELGSKDSLGDAFRSPDGKIGRVTLYRRIFDSNYTAGDRLAIMGHELRHLEPDNYALYQDVVTRFRSQFQADQYGMRLGEALYDRDYSRGYRLDTIMQPLRDCRKTTC